jgi:hypothetical protein
MAAEAKCERTNRRFSKGRFLRSRYSSQVVYAREWIRHVLGDEPDIVAIQNGADFSSGSSIGVTGNATNIFRKFNADSWSVNPMALPYSLPALWSNNHYAALLCPKRNGYYCFDFEAVREVTKKKVKLTSCNKVDFVPKTAKTDRSIAVEPTLNAFIQKGIDEFLRARLRSVGIDLRDQGKNAHLAKIGSLDGSLATLDLSSASDSVSTNLVKVLLPPAWFALLERTRSPSFELDGVVRRYHKFVSMGNGFCFPLETLIFAALARSAIHSCGTQNRTYSVYGDDIIIPTEATSTLRMLLAFCGFTVNMQKSFWEGHFRESCGADWYQGQDVRPVYLDSEFCHIHDVFIFHNATLRSDRTSLFFEGVRKYLRAVVPKAHRYMRPMWANVHVPRFSAQRNLEWFDVACTQGAFTVPEDVFMSSAFAVWSRGRQRWQWKELSFSPVLDKPAPDDREIFDQLRYISLLRGSPQGRITLRRKTKVAVVTK